MGIGGVRMFSDLREEQENIIRNLTNKNIELQNCYNNNLQLCKRQEQQINKLATIIEKISKVLEVYFDDDNRATREIERIISEVTK